MNAQALSLLELSTLQTMQTQWIACLTAIAVGHQSYSLAGRSFTRANLREVSEMLEAITMAIALKGGSVQREVVSDMSN